MFRKAADFEGFDRVMVEAHHHEPIRILAHCILSGDHPFAGESAIAFEDGGVTYIFKSTGEFWTILGN